MQQAIVADHIEQLHAEAAALRAERAVRDGATPRAGRDPARVRIGHWLMTLGAGIAGPAASEAAGADRIHEHRKDHTAAHVA